MVKQTNDNARFVVIFYAIAKEVDAEYDNLAIKLRDLAMSRYHCQRFVSVTEENQEVTLSYWQSMDDIARWKSNAEHQFAQQTGQESFYQYYRIEVAEISRQYSVGSIPADGELS